MASQPSQGADPSAAAANAAAASAASQQHQGGAHAQQVAGYQQAMHMMHVQGGHVANAGAMPQGYPQQVLFQGPCLALLLAQSLEVLQVLLQVEFQPRNFAAPIPLSLFGEEEEPEEEEVKKEESKQEGEASAAAESTAAAEAVAAAPGAAAGSSLEADAEEDDDFGDFSSVPSASAAPTASTESAASTVAPIAADSDPTTAGSAVTAAPVLSAAAVPAAVSVAAAGAGSVEEEDEWGDFSDSFAPAPAAPAAQPIPSQPDFSQANIPQVDATNSPAPTVPAPSFSAAALSHPSPAPSPSSFLGPISLAGFQTTAPAPSAVEAAAAPVAAAGGVGPVEQQQQQQEQEEDDFADFVTSGQSEAPKPAQASENQAVGDLTSFGTGLSTAFGSAAAAAPTTSAPPTTPAPAPAPAPVPASVSASFSSPVPAAMAFDPDDDFGDFSSSPAVPSAAFAPAVAAPAPAAASGLGMAAATSSFPPFHDSTPQFSAPGFGAFAPPPGASAAAPAAPPPAFAPPAAAPTAAVNKEISFDDDDDDFGDFAGSVAVSGSASSGRGDTAATGAVSASPEFVGVDLSSTAVTPDPSLRLDDSGAANPVLVPSNSVAAAAETAALAAAMSVTHAAAAADGAVASAAAVGVAAGPIPLSLFGDDVAVAELENAELSLGPFPSAGSSKPSDHATCTGTGVGVADTAKDVSTTAGAGAGASAGAAGTGKSGNLMDLLSSLYGSSSAGTATGTGGAAAAAGGGGAGVGGGGGGAGGRLEGGRLGQTFSTGRVPLAMASAAGYGGLFGLLSPGTPPTDVPLRGSMSEQVGQRGRGGGGVGGSLSGESGEGWEEQGDGFAGGTGLSFAAVDGSGSGTGGGGGDGSGASASGAPGASGGPSGASGGASGASGASYRSSGLPGGGLQGLAADHVLPIVGAQLGEGVFTASITAALESVLQPTVIRLPNEASQKRWEETLQELAEGAESVARNEFGRLSGELVREGRMEEAYACRLHAAAVQLLPDCQGQYSMALGDGRVEAAAAVREDIKVSALSLLSPRDMMNSVRGESAGQVFEAPSPAAVEGWRERRMQAHSAPPVPTGGEEIRHVDKEADVAATEGDKDTADGDKAATQDGLAGMDGGADGGESGLEGTEGGVTKTEEAEAAPESRPGRDLASLRWDERSVGEMGELQEQHLLQPRASRGGGTWRLCGGTSVRWGRWGSCWGGARETPYLLPNLFTLFTLSAAAAGAPATGEAVAGSKRGGRDLASLRWDERSVGEMGELLGRSKGDARAAAFDGEFKQAEICDLAARDLTAALLVHRRAVFWYNILSAVSATEAASFVRLWGAVAARCADVLEAAVGVKEKAAADGTGTLSALLDNPKARDYFAAITQTYGVLVVIAACAQLHRPWLSVRLGTGSAGPPPGSGESGSLAGGGSGEGEQGGGDGEGDILWAHLLRGQAAWQNGGLEAVANEVLPRVMVPLSWSDVEKVLEGAELAAVQRAAELALEGRQRHMGLVGGSGTLLCALTRLPIFAFTCKLLFQISALFLLMVLFLFCLLGKGK
ncbi:unnamed protein product [Closterium sp. Naga37s-1]|nr:unnamed protein product [Closterium sp. Naga37s-1]